MIKSKEGAKKIFIPKANLKPFLKPLLSILFTGLIIFSLYYTFTIINPLKPCNDGSLTGECSRIKPYYCQNGKLIQRASICGCNNVSYGQDETCITNYQNQSKNITLNYTLRGKQGQINYIVYYGLVEYLDSIPISINYKEDDIPSRQDFKIRRTYEPEQKALIQPLVTKIQGITPNEKDQFRIAVSLIQSIPFGFSNKTEFAFTQTIYHERYPYEVLYDNQGICGEKSDLLSLLLKEMGYNTAIFFHRKENHESVGVRCPREFSLRGTGYCFIETTGPSIITNDKIIYTDGTKLQTIPEIMQISNGGALDKNMYEYEDSQTLINIDKKIEEVGRLNPLELYKLNNLKEKYHLAESYDPR